MITSVEKEFIISHLYPEDVGRDSGLLRAGRSGDGILVGARFSAPVQTGLPADPSLLYKGYWVILWGTAAGEWR